MYLADTNLLSESRQKIPSLKALRWIAANESKLYISAVSIGELELGKCLLPNGTKRLALEKWVERLRKDFQEVILPFDEGVAVTWGNLWAELIQKGRPIPVTDSFLAATAFHHGLTLATRNSKDFVGTGVAVVNPWQAT